jgi:hypothetical protein
MTMSNRGSRTKLFSELSERHEPAFLNFATTLVDLSLLCCSGPLLRQEIRSEAEELDFHIVELGDYLVKFSLCVATGMIDVDPSSGLPVFHFASFVMSTNYPL